MRRHRIYSAEKERNPRPRGRGRTYSAEVREGERKKKKKKNAAFAEALSFPLFFSPLFSSLFSPFAARYLVTASVKIEARGGCIERSKIPRSLKTVTMIYKRYAMLKHKRFSSSCGNAAFHCALYRALYRSRVRGRSANTGVPRVLLYLFSNRTNGDIDCGSWRKG